MRFLNSNRRCSRIPPWVTTADRHRNTIVPSETWRKTRAQIVCNLTQTCTALSSPDTKIRTDTRWNWFYDKAPPRPNVKHTERACTPLRNFVRRAKTVGPIKQEQSSELTKMTEPSLMPNKKLPRHALKTHRNQNRGRQGDRRDIKISLINRAEIYCKKTFSVSLFFPGP